MSVPMQRLSAPARLFLLAVSALVVALSATARSEDRATTDPSGKAAAIADTSRIVSIGGSITEILYALGLQQKIVAVDTTSLYPPAALQEKPNVGYMRQLSAEGVLALSPTLVLALQGSGPKETVDILQRRGFLSSPCRTNSPAKASSRKSVWSRRASARLRAANVWRVASTTN
jgi:iron complex transport system substrate-binding protein